MCPECSEYVPNCPKLRAHSDFLWRLALAYENRQDNGTDRLSRVDPQNASQGLSDVDLASARIDEHDAIDAWHIDSFCQAACVCDDAMLRIGSRCQFRQQSTTNMSLHLPGYKGCFHFYARLSNGAHRVSDRTDVPLKPGGLAQ
ncbi:hypothetical protein GCM10009080_57520 [Cupriavidus pauculus]